MKRQRGLATLLAAFGVAALIALVHSFHTREAAAKGGGGTTGPTLRFQLVSLGTLGGQGSTAYGINDDGDVVGAADLPGGGSAGFVWFYSTGRMWNLNALHNTGWIIGGAAGINSNGQIACTGNYLTTESTPEVALRLEPVPGSTPSNPAYTVTVVGENWTVANGINDSGDVVGTDDDQIAERAFLYTDELGLEFISGMTRAQAISDRQNATDPTSACIAGTLDVPGTFHTHAIRYTPAHGIQDLGVIGGSNSSGTGVNASGQTAGTTQVKGGSYHAFRYTDAVGMVDLGANTSNMSGAEKGINSSHGDVVGVGIFPFIYMDGYGAVDIRTLTTNVSPSTTLLSVTAINNYRDIAGDYNGIACILEVTHP
jgi:probable HAF family extracellular repeat protein